MESIYPILAKGHGGLAILLAAFALFSLALAGLSTATGTKPAILRFSNIVGTAETAIAGLVTLSGLAVLLFGPFPIATIWAWVGLVMIVVYSVLMKRATKPARIKAETDGAGRWALFSLIQFALVIGAFGLMHAKPF